MESSKGKQLITQTRCPIVPKPVQFNSNGNFYEINKPLLLSARGVPRRIIHYIIELMNELYNISLKLHESNENITANDIVMEISIDGNANIPSNEGYIININEDRMIITGKTEQGLFYGIQSFRQLLRLSKKGSNSTKTIKILHCNVQDYPRFPWRGYMLDVGRYFHDKPIIKKLIDVMALIKLNKLHLHLTDDQGWRFNVPDLPKLTEVGSKRGASNIRGRLINKTDDIPHEGHFTASDIRELIDYARDRYIEIVPEIDMPGHIRAALAAYPELSCSGEEKPVPALFKIYKDVLCIGNEQTVEFSKTVFSEVFKVFDSDIIHIGGDEVPRERWENCEKCQKKMRELGLSDEAGLQHYFTNILMDYLKKHGKTTMGWNEIIKTEPHPDAIVQHWLRDTESVKDHLERGGKVVSSNFFSVYFNYDYVVIPLRKTYAYNPVPDGLAKSAQENMFGVEAAIWTQWIKDPFNLFMYTFPRLIALAEVGWTLVKRKNYADFKTRLKNHFLSHLKLLDVPFMPLKKVDPNPIRRLAFPIHILLGSKTLHPKNND